MKLYTVARNGTTHVAFEKDGKLNEVAASDMIAYIKGEGRESTGRTFAFNEVTIQAPLRPGKLFCSGLNYKSHIEENPNATFLDDPRFFVKTPNTVIGPGEAIRHPGTAFQVDYEVELAVVVGKPLFRPKQSDVMEHIFGYTILHDVSARAVQFKDKNEDMGKNFDTFAPLGPCIVTADEIPDPSKLRLRLLRNGVVLQDGTNEDWCFPLPRLLAWLAMGITLQPGDVISTGTPAGIGYFRDPQVFLEPGDICRLEIERIGVLENPVVAIEEPAHLEWEIDREVGG